MPPLNANITNTVALVPGYFGGTLAQRRDLRDQQRRVAVTVLPAVAGGIIGGALLLQTGTTLFCTLVPLAHPAGDRPAGGLQPALKRTVLRRLQAPARGKPANLAGIGVTAFAGAIYGGYFGAGLGASSCWRSSRSCCPTH